MNADRVIPGSGETRHVNDNLKKGSDNPSQVNNLRGHLAKTPLNGTMSSHTISLARRLREGDLAMRSEERQGDVRARNVERELAWAAIPLREMPGGGGVHVINSGSATTSREVPGSGGVHVVNSGSTNASRAIPTAPAYFRTPLTTTYDAREVPGQEGKSYVFTSSSNHAQGGYRSRLFFQSFTGSIPRERIYVYPRPFHFQHYQESSVFEGVDIKYDYVVIKNAHYERINNIRKIILVSSVIFLFLAVLFSNLPFLGASFSLLGLSFIIYLFNEIVNKKFIKRPGID